MADRLPWLSPLKRVRPIARRPPPCEPRTEGLAATVWAETDGLGLEYAFDCVGHPGLLQQFIDLVQKGGSVIEVGMADPAALAFIRPYQLFEKELTVKSSDSRPYAFARAVRWLPRLTLGPLLGVEFPLAETKTAIHSLREGKGVKILLLPDNWQSLFQFISWTICIKQPASDNRFA